GKPIGCGTYLSLFAHSLLDYFKPSKLKRGRSKKVFRKLLHQIETTKEQI
ncbi:hypothetical protein AVEN_70689-1, partial [Araneus ventricosus]